MKNINIVVNNCYKILPVTVTGYDKYYMNLAYLLKLHQNFVRSLEPKMLFKHIKCANADVFFCHDVNT